MSTDVVVVGGGLAGLVAARHLGAAELDVTLLERRDTLGGRVRTRTVDGFTLDRGFQVLFDAYPAVARELDLDALDVRAFSPGATICRPGSRAVLADPLRDPRRAIESVFNHEVSLSDKFRTLALRYDLSRSSEMGLDESPAVSIRSYLEDWGFSEEYIDHFIAPLYGGITLDRQLSTSATVFEYTFRMMSTGRTVIPAEGMGAIPAQVANRAREAGVEFRTGVRVESIQIDESTDPIETSPGDSSVLVRTTDGSIEASAVVVAATPPEAARLTGIDRIPTDGVGCVTQWYTLPEGTPFETGRRLLLNAESPAPNTVVPISEVIPEYAPADRALLCATFLGDDTQEASADSLTDLTREALGSWYPERSFTGLELVATDRVPFAQFRQPPGFRDRLPSVDDPGGPVFLAGEYTEWSSIQGAMQSGATAATAVLESVFEESGQYV